MDKYTIKAYAKINLGLDVEKRLPNGYHQVRMIMQSVDLWDVLTFQKAGEGINLTCDCRELPLDGNNLVFKAAKLMLEKYHITEGVSIHLKKNIPVAAGMAGGSTDAAAAMKGICKLFQLDVSPRQLAEYGMTIGADVPYCLMGGTALAEGIGEKLTPLPPLPHCHILVAKPDINVSTKYIYQHLDVPGLKHHPDIDGMLHAVRTENLQGVLCRMENVLETVTIKLWPVIDLIKSKMLENGAAACLMSGSGPSVFGIFPKEEESSARAALSALKQTGLAKQVCLTRPVSAGSSDISEDSDS